MAPQLPSIQSFFEKEVSLEKDSFLNASHKACSHDGFTKEEIEAALLPTCTLHKWLPRGEYQTVDISTLVPGPGCVTLMGRVVNFHDQHTPSKKPQAAKGCLKVVIKDDTGTLLVKLWYAKVQYNLCLGQLVSIWTTHISNAETNSLTFRNASLTTSIFPERDNSCYFMIQEHSGNDALCRAPLDYKEGKQLAGLMTLKSFAEGGYDVTDSKILVCLKSVGMRKKFTDKKGNPVEKVDVNVFDDTFEAALSLWNHLCPSAAAWKPSKTLLLITNAGYRGEGRSTITISYTTQVEVDPEMHDATWLRSLAQRLTKRDHVNQPFPMDVFDVESALASENRILFTIANIDQFVRAAPNEIYIGYLSVLIAELNISRLHQRNMLCCTECCGIPFFANATSTKCKQCSMTIQLRLNPRLVGTLIDETGCIGPGKLVWSTPAWEQLFGRSAERVVEGSAQVLKDLEQRLLFLRVNLLFGWSGEVGRLAVCGVDLLP